MVSLQRVYAFFSSFGIFSSYHMYIVTYNQHKIQYILLHYISRRRNCKMYKFPSGYYVLKEDFFQIANRYVYQLDVIH